MESKIKNYLRRKGIFLYIHHEITVKDISHEYNVSEQYIYRLMHHIYPDIENARKKKHRDLVNQLYDLLDHCIPIEIIKEHTNYFKYFNYSKDDPNRIIKQKLKRLFMAENHDKPLIMSLCDVKQLFVRINIYNDLQKKCYTQVEIAKKYNVAQSYVGKINKNGFLLSKINCSKKDKIMNSYNVVHQNIKVDDVSQLNILLNIMKKEF